MDNKPKKAPPARFAAAKNTTQTDEIPIKPAANLDDMPICGGKAPVTMNDDEDKPLAKGTYDLDKSVYMGKLQTQSNLKTMQGGGFLPSEAPAPTIFEQNQQLDELDDPRHSHYEFMEPKFRGPMSQNNTIGGIASGRSPGKIQPGGSFSKVREPEESVPPRLSTQKLWPDAGDPGSANFQQDTRGGSDSPLKR